MENNYIVLARRTRPQSLSELVGQEVVAHSITSMLTSQKIPHAFLFTGTRGTGKTSSARILAKSLCCEKGPTPYPCQTCVHCKQITACAHDDILEIDGASNTGVDNVRELSEAARFYPHSAKFKIFIIDEVHMLSAGAFNALLKTLEEPPSQVIFILATTELHKVPITVRSRCMIFSFKKIETSVIANHLKEILIKEKITFDDDAIQIIAREAKGSLRDSLSLLEQAIAICGDQHLDVHKTKNGLCVQGEELAERLFSAICQKKTDLAFEFLQEANRASLDIGTLIENTATLFRSAILVKTLGNKERVLRLTQLLEKEYEFLEQESLALTSAALSEIFKALSHSVREISRTTAPLPWAEMVVVDCILRADWLSASDLIALLKTTQEPATKPSYVDTKPMSSQVKPSYVDTKPMSSDVKVIHEDINLDLYRKFVEHTRTKSEILATKLKFVKVQVFNAQQIEFAETQENATYLSFNAQDSELFWNSLKELGLDKAQIKCKYLPTKVATQKENNPPRQLSVQEEKKGLGSVPSSKESANNMLKNFQKFSSSVSQTATTRTSSLNDVYKEEKNRAHKEKSNKIMAMESVQELSKFATEIQILDG